VKRLTLATALLVFLAPPALAADGVTEINQAKAIAGGVVAGDTAGFPVSLSGPGSYVLTSDLTLIDPNLTAIELTGDEITLDLNGFALIGPVTCTSAGSNLSCLPSGTGQGIAGSDDDFITVRNGQVRGFASTGVRIGDYGRVHGVVARENGGDGFYVGTGSLVRECVAAYNGGDGFEGDTAPIFRQNSSRSNKESGYEGDLGSVYLGNVAYDNGQDGITALAGTNVIHDNVISNSEANGITSGAGGIVTRNISRGNSDYGLSLDSTAAYGFNLVLKSGNGVGTVSDGLNLGGNRCLASTTQSSCP